MRTYQTVFSDIDVSVLIVDKIVCQNCCTEPNTGSFAYVDTTGVGLIELRSRRYSGAFSDIHTPHADIIEAPELI